VVVSVIGTEAVHLAGVAARMLRGPTASRFWFCTTSSAPMTFSHPLRKEV